MPTRLPLGLMFIDPPGRYDTVETWEQFLAELEAMPPSTTRNAARANAKQTIRMKQREKGLTKGPQLREAPNLSDEAEGPVSDQAASE